LPEEFHVTWKNIIYYRQSKRDVILEVRDARISIDMRNSIRGLQEEEKECRGLSGSI
jgi:hypothetical protein